MTITVHVEHQIIGDETVLEKFKGVDSYNDPPMTDNLHLTFADDRDDKKLSYGNVVRATSEDDPSNS